MSEVKYSKDAVKHIACVKVKRELVKLVKKHPDIDFWIDLTGSEKFDLLALRNIEGELYKRMAVDIENSIRENSDLGYHGFYISWHLEQLNFIKGLYEVQKLVSSSYGKPVDEMLRKEGWDA